MPVRRDAEIEISAFDWVPDFARGLVRDLRVRWALEEAGLPYRERLLDARGVRPEDYLREQPFGQVPTYRDDQVRMFESGAIVLHIAERCEALMPTDPAGRARTQTWVLAALNTVETPIIDLVVCNLFGKDQDWAEGFRPVVMERIRRCLGRLDAWLDGRDYLEDRFTAGDLMMTCVLHPLRSTDLLSEWPGLVAYKARCESRPAYTAALDAQIAAFEARALQTA
jgi:glutathione S-transferase